ncbi:uncharacterized protein N7500_010353 [Penicillium coprophilum]|uniref:uncharacterized protein n=1 Tax=Penicillium coprophilum TaxID=36646 RepID=UPI00238B57C5|nr:uncharacterized protein N7500_010353 [Penicillium coprophilum]KAJ5154914.1 hypothetical protein N7500_010353 [Penicillium coprophilum]
MDLGMPIFFRGINFELGNTFSIYFEVPINHYISYLTLRYLDFSPSNIIVRKLYTSSEAFSLYTVSLGRRLYFFKVLKSWPMSLDRGAQTGSIGCQIHFSEEENYRQEQEKLQELGEMRDIIGIDALGWVPDEDELERCRAVIQSIKDGLIEHSITEMEKAAVLSHFPFDDYEENA